MAFTSSAPIIIRPAVADEYVEFGRLHAKAFLPDPLWQLLVAKIDPNVWSQWYFDEQARDDVNSGFARLIVARRTDTDELKVGMQRKISRWILLGSNTNPKGYNIIEAEKIIVPRVAWIRNVVETYGKCIHLQEIFIAKDYHGTGIGKQLMVKIINEAKESGCNMTLTAGPGVEGFYMKCGFEDVGEPYLLSDGDVRISRMFMEQFLPLSSS